MYAIEVKNVVKKYNLYTSDKDILKEILLMGQHNQQQVK